MKQLKIIVLTIIIGFVPFSGKAFECQFCFSYDSERPDTASDRNADRSTKIDSEKGLTCDWSFQNVQKAVNGYEITYNLNGLWNFLPLESGNVTPPPEEYPGYMKVPGLWRQQNFSEFLFRPKSGSSPTNIYNGKTLAEYDNAWYGRTFECPFEEKDKEIYLHFERIMADGVLICVNGKEVFRAENPLGNIDVNITASVHSGINSLDVFCVKSNAQVQAGDLSGGMVSRQVGLGILDDVELRIRPKVSLDNALIATFFDNRELKVRYTVVNAEEKMLPARVDVSVEHNGATVFQAGQMNLELKYGSNTSEFSANWPKPILWSPENPQMCDLKLELFDKDGMLLDVRKYRFGFREVTIQNGTFYLNGKKIFFRFETTPLSNGWQTFSNSSRDGIIKYFTILKKSGFNGMRNCFERGITSRQMLEIADEMGIMMWMFTLGRGHKELDEADEAFWKKYDADVKNCVESIHNHPCVFMWVSDNWYNMKHGFAWPQLLGEKDIRNQQRTDKLCMVDALYKKHDLNKRIVSGSCDAWYGGETYSAHPYFGFHFQAQERNDWPEHWAEKKQFPLVTGEFGLPYVEDYRNVADRKSRQRYTLENTARYLGNDAYLAADGTDLTPTTHTCIPGESHAYRVISQGKEKPVLFFCNPSVVAQKKIFAEGLFYWRIYGVSLIGLFDELTQYNSTGMVMNRYDVRGINPPTRDDFSATSGLKPDAYCGFPYGYWNCDPTAEGTSIRPTAVFYAFKSVYAPLTARIVGHKEHFSSVTANYFSGEKVEKQIAVVNQSEKDATVCVSWELRDANGAVQASGKQNLQVPCGETVMAPLEFTLPKRKSRTEYTIYLKAESDGLFFARDTFKIHSFPRDSVSVEKTICVIDSEGGTSAMLNRAGLPFETIEKISQAPKGAILIVGRQSMDATMNFTEALDGGLNILSFEQKGMTGQNIVEEVRQRYAFPEALEHPVFEGLQTTDFRNWRGETALLEKYPPLPEGKLYGHWGTEGIVCTGALQKPPVAPCRVLADCDFDLRSAALLEYYGKNGRHVVCQFDVTDKYGVEPAATILVNNILRYLDSSFEGTVNSLAVIGNGEKAKKMFSVAEVAYHEEDKVGTFTPQTVVALDGTTDFASLCEKWDLAGHAWNGGTVLVFADEDLNITKLPFYVGVQKKNVRFARVEGQGIAQGVGNSDLYFRYDFPMLVFDIPQKMNAPSPALFAEVPFGAGRFVFIGFDPEDAPVKEDCFAKEKSLRVLSTIFTNLALPKNCSVTGTSLSLSVLDLEDVEWKFANEEEVKGSDWIRPEFNDEAWSPIKLGPWKQQIPGFDLGTGLYRIRFKTPAGGRKQVLQFVCGRMVDIDETFLNGEKIGETTWKDGNPWQRQRAYSFDGAMLKPEGEENVLCIKVFVGGANGGIVGKPVWIIKKPHEEQKEFKYPANMETCY